MYAVKVGLDPEHVALLLKTDPETVNAVNQHGDSAIMFASAAGNVSAIQQLVAAGGNVVTANREALTPFHCAVRATYLVCLQFLIFGPEKRCRRQSVGGLSRFKTDSFGSNY